MAYNDSSIFMGQGQVFLQRRLRNGLPLGPFIFAGEADKFAPTLKQTFDAVAESQSGLRMTTAKPVTRTEATLDMNFLDHKKSNLVAALQATDTGAVAPGTVTAETQSAYNNGVGAPVNASFNLNNIGSSSEVLKLAGTAAQVASIAVLTSGVSVLYSQAIALTFTGGTGCAGFAYTNAAGAVVGVIVTNPGTGTLPTAVAATGSTATFQINAGVTPLVLNTDYTMNSVYGTVTILPGSTLVPAFGYSTAAPQDGTAGLTSVTCAYAYSAYTGKIEAFTTGIQYYTARLNGFNTVNNQPIVATIYQMQMEMTKTLALIEAKHGDLALAGEILQDTTKPLPSVTNPYSQFMTIVKA